MSFRPGQSPKVGQQTPRIDLKIPRGKKTLIITEKLKAQIQSDRTKEDIHYKNRQILKLKEASVIENTIILLQWFKSSLFLQKPYLPYVNT